MYTLKKNFIKFDVDKPYSFEEVFPDHHPGKALHGLRTRESLTPKDMAASIGMTHAQFMKYESGEETISEDTAKKIADMYGVSYRSLL